MGRRVAHTFGRGGKVAVTAIGGITALAEPGFIELDEDGLGGLGFIAVTGELDFATRIVMAGRASSSRGKAPTRATT